MTMTLEMADMVVTKTILVLEDALKDVLENLNAVTSGSPWIENYTCFFCGGAREHMDSCQYKKARYILEEYANVR